MHSLSPCQTPFWNLNLARESKKQRITPELTGNVCTQGPGAHFYVRGRGWDLVLGHQPPARILVTVSTWQNSVFILVPSEYRNGARCQGTMCGGCLSFHSKCGAGSILRLIRCLMVGLPWGQFQGCSIFPMWQATSFFCVWLSEAPTLMVMRHAQLANIFLTLEGLHITPGESLNMKISSSMSLTPNVQFLLMERETSLTFFIASALWSISKSNQFFWNICTLFVRIAWLAAVSSNFLVFQPTFTKVLVSPQNKCYRGSIFSEGGAYLIKRGWSYHFSIKTRMKKQLRQMKFGVM